MLQQLHGLCSQQQSANTATDNRLTELLHLITAANQPAKTEDEPNESKTYGIVVHGREPHIPRQLVPPLHQVLSEDLKWASEQPADEDAAAAEGELPEASFKFDFLLLVSTFSSAAVGAEDKIARSEQDEAPNAKKRKLWSPDWAYYLERIEDGFYHKHAEWSCLVGPMPGEQKDNASPNTASFVVSCIQVNKLEGIGAELNTVLQ